MELLWIVWVGFTWLTGTRCELPQWVYTDLSERTVITASDPGLDYRQAYRQALQRGVYLYALKKGNRLQLLHDYFTFTDTGTNRHEEVSDKVLLLSRITCNEKRYYYCVFDEYVSSFGEVFLKMSFNSSDTCNAVGVSVSGGMEIMLNNNKRMDNLTCKVNIRTIEEADTIISEYVTKRIGTRILRSSVMNGKQLDLSGKECWYVAGGDTGVGKTSRLLIPLKYSFWNACVLSLSESLIANPFKEVKIRCLNEKYDTSVRELHREKVETDISILMEKLSIESDNLYVEWLIE